MADKESSSIAGSFQQTVWTSNRFVLGNIVVVIFFFLYILFSLVGSKDKLGNIDNTLPTQIIIYSKWKFTAPNIIHDEKISGDYIIRIYKDPASAVDNDGMAIISTLSEKPLRIDTAVAIDQQTGKDITGDERPEIIFYTHSGTRDCCYRIWIYETYPSLRLLEKSPYLKCIVETSPFKNMIFNQYNVGLIKEDIPLPEGFIRDDD